MLVQARTPQDWSARDSSRAGDVESPCRQSHQGLGYGSFSHSAHIAPVGDKVIAWTAIVEDAAGRVAMSTQEPLLEADEYLSHVLAGLWKSPFDFCWGCRLRHRQAPRDAREKPPMR